MHFSNDSYELKSDEDGKVPLLKTLFEKFPNSYINIDIKGVNSELVH